MKEEPEDVDVRHYCRICFEEKPDLVSCQNVLVLEDFTCTVEEILLLLSSQEVRALPTYPTKICPTCKELVEATFALKIMYEKTSDILCKLLSPIEEEIKIIEEEIKIKVEPSKSGNSDGITEGEELLKILYEHSENDEPKYEIDETYNTEGNIVPAIGDSFDIQEHDQPEYYQLKEETNYNGEIFETEEETDEPEDTSQPEDDDDQFYENFDIEEHTEIDEENAQVEATKSQIEEEQIILEIEDAPLFGLTRNEKRNLYRKRRRYLEKQKALSLGQKIEEEIEQTLNNSKIELKIPDNLSHVCPICFIEKTDALEFRQHIHSHRVLKKYFKGKPLPEKSRIVAQPRNTISIFNRPNSPHWCPYCNESLPALKFGIHLWNHERLDEFYCNKCDRIFFKLRDYNLHKVRSHREEYPFKCNICHQGFVIKYNYDCHMLKHNSKEEDLPYACEECPRKFSNSIHLWRHMHIHNGKGVYGSQYKKYRCPKCKRDFGTWTAFNTHMCQDIRPKKTTIVSTGTAVWKKEFPCRYCDKKFKNYNGVYQHVRKTHENKRHSKICEVCGKSISNYSTHMKVHSGHKQTPRMCDICGKSFTSIQNYLRHRKALHSNKAPYLCDVCGKSFVHYDSFKTHERIHIGNKCHICPVCGKGFLEKSYMKKHLVTHDKRKFARVVRSD